MQFEFQQNKWHGDEPVFIDIPDDWEIYHDTMLCDQTPRLTAEEIRDKIDHPVAGPTLQEMAQGKHRVAIVFDDMSRPTPVQDIAEPVLDILLSSGVKKEEIIFVCGSGNHGALTREDFAKKLGEQIVTDYFVYNHNPYENLVKIGTAKRGFDVLFNKEVAQCDLIVGIGAMIPHAANGFSGGYKILFPGVAGIDTMTQIHQYGSEERKRLIAAGIPVKSPMGHLPEKGMRFEIEECGKMAPPLFKVDCFVNTRSQVVEIFAGEPIEEYYKAAEKCRYMYQISKPEEADVIIINSNFKSNESNVSYNIGLGYYSFAKKKKGDIVLINFAKSGQVPHYLLGYFGNSTRGRLCGGGRPDPREPECKTYYFSKYGDKSGMQEIGIKPERYVWMTKWEDILAELKKTHGPGTKCLVIDEGSIVSFKED